MIFRALNPHIELGKLLTICGESMDAIFGKKHNLDLNAIFHLITANMCRIFVAEKDEEIIGYSYFILGRNFFKAEQIQADCQVIYVKPGHRKNGTAAKLLQHSEITLQVEGVHKIMFSANMNPKLARFLNIQGYNISNTFMAKEF